jgi:hypothetical protein
LADLSQNADVWWLDVQSGVTGKLTNDGLSFNADWLPTHQRAGGPSTGPTTTPNPALTRRFFLPVAVRNRESSGPIGAFGTPVAYPTREPAVQPTPLPTPANPTAVPPRGIRGRVTFKGAAVANINVNLEHCPPTLSCEVVMRTRTDSNGAFVFETAPNASIFGYTVSFRNSQAEGQNTPDARYAAYMGIGLLNTTRGERVDAGILEIADVALNSPSSGASVATPATFSWSARGIEGETYLFGFNYGGLGACTPSNFSTATSHTISSLECSFPSIPTGQTFLWWVDIASPNGVSGRSQPRPVQFTQ